MRDDLEHQLDGLLRRAVELGERTDVMLDGACAALRDLAPVGHDLRRLTAMLRVSRHLERMGDHAVGVAKADHGVGLAEQTVSVVTGERVEFSSNDPT